MTVLTAAAAAGSLDLLLVGAQQPLFQLAVLLLSVQLVLLLWSLRLLYTLLSCYLCLFCCAAVVVAATVVAAHCELLMLLLCSSGRLHHAVSARLPARSPFVISEVRA